MNKAKVSPIFSLADAVEITVKHNRFEPFGKAFDGHHVVIMFKPVIATPLRFDYKNPIVMNRHCTMYNIINNRGTLYGHLFVVDIDATRLTANTLVVSCDDGTDTSYVPEVISNDKTKLNIFKNSSGTMLALMAGAEDTTYVVEDA